MRSEVLFRSRVPGGECSLKVRPTHADRDGAAKGPRDDRAAPERNAIIGSCVGKDRSGAVREGDFSARCGIPNGMRAALIFDAGRPSPPRATDTAGARAEERFERGPLSVSGMTIGSATTRNEADAKPWSARPPVVRSLLFVELTGTTPKSPEKSRGPTTNRPTIDAAAALPIQRIRKAKFASPCTSRAATGCA
jgi:hypothetical protein